MTFPSLLFKGIGEEISSIYYSSIYEGWIIDLWISPLTTKYHYSFLYKFVEDDIDLLLYDESILHVPFGERSWSFHAKHDVFSSSCNVNLTISCKNSPAFTPTRAPTPAPTFDPTTSPTMPPSNSPSQPPTNTPSQPPSNAPTYSPLQRFCSSFDLSIIDDFYFNLTNISNDDYFIFDGIYNLQNTLINGYSWWKHKENPGTKIFYSSVIYHKSWVIQSDETKSYWLWKEFNVLYHSSMSPLIESWEYYEHDNIFPVINANISLGCYLTSSPTTEPTFSPSLTPSFSPSNAPSYSPSNAPSLSPSNNPSNAPSISPSNAPTSAPTTPPPTNAPTFAPTREECPYLQVSTTSSNTSSQKNNIELSSVVQ